MHGPDPFLRYQPWPASPEREGMFHVHHLDTPLAARTGQLYIDSLYMFPGEGRAVFVIDVNSNVNGLRSKHFHPEHAIEFKVRFDGATRRP